MTTLCHVRATSHLARIIALDAFTGEAGETRFRVGETQDAQVGQELDVYAAEGRVLLIIEPEGTVVHELLAGLEEARDLYELLEAGASMNENDWRVVKRSLTLASLLAVVPEPAQPREAPPPVPDPIVPAPSS